MLFANLFERWNNMSEKTMELYNRLVPMVVEQTPQGERSFDIFSRLKDIYLYINSPGGVITSGMAIYDTMRYISCDINTLCIGQACSMGSFLLAGGTKGKRFALPNSQIMIHQPSGGAKGQAADIEIQARLILDMRRRLNNIYAENTGQKLAVIEKAMDRDNFMTPEEALKFGLIDQIVTSRKEISAKGE